MVMAGLMEMTIQVLAAITATMAMENLTEMITQA